MSRCISNTSIVNYYVDSGTVPHLWTVPLIFSRYWPTSDYVDFLCGSDFIFYWNIYYPEALPQFYRFLEEDKLSSASQINEFSYLSFFIHYIHYGKTLSKNPFRN